MGNPGANAVKGLPSATQIASLDVLVMSHDHWIHIFLTLYAVY